MTTRDEIIDLLVKNLIELLLEPCKITKNLEEKLDIVIEKIESLEKRIEKKKDSSSSEEEKSAFSWF